MSQLAIDTLTLAQLDRMTLDQLDHLLLNERVGPLKKRKFRMPPFQDDPGDIDALSVAMIEMRL